MKNLTFATLFTVLFAVTAHGQSDTYFTYGGEMIFSFGDITYNGQETETLMRWAPVFNIQGHVHADLSDHFGLFSGLGIRNVGYIFEGYRDPVTEATYKKKFRTYNLAIPAGIKFGDLDEFFFYAGYEAEFPFVYKEKTFDGGDKIDKIVGWFSSRTKNFQHGPMFGIQFPDGPNLKFKYYLSEFHNQQFTDGNGVKPYAGLETHVFYFSLNYVFSRGWRHW